MILSVIIDKNVHGFIALVARSYSEEEVGMGLFDDLFGAPSGVNGVKLSELTQNTVPTLTGVIQIILQDLLTIHHQGKMYGSFNSTSFYYNGRHTIKYEWNDESFFQQLISFFSGVNSSVVASPALQNEQKKDIQRLALILEQILPLPVLGKNLLGQMIRTLLTAMRLGWCDSMQQVAQLYEMILQRYTREQPVLFSDKAQTAIAKRRGIKGNDVFLSKEHVVKYLFAILLKDLVLFQEKQAQLKAKKTSTVDFEHYKIKRELPILYDKPKNKLLAEERQLLKSQAQLTADKQTVDSIQTAYSLLKLEGEFYMVCGTKYRAASHGKYHVLDVVNVRTGSSRVILKLDTNIPSNSPALQRIDDKIKLMERSRKTLLARKQGGQFLTRDLAHYNFKYKKLYLLMFRMDRDLSSYLKEKIVDSRTRLELMPATQRLMIAKLMVDELCSWHVNDGMAHRDFKLDNFGVDIDSNTGQVTKLKAIDYETAAKMAEIKERTVPAYGTVGLEAPEYLNSRNTGDLNFQADIYTMALSLSMILAGSLWEKWPRIRDEERFYTDTGARRLLIAESISAVKKDYDGWEILDKMLDERPATRPSASAVQREFAKIRPK